jgi:hypothetical protein
MKSAPLLLIGGLVLAAAAVAVPMALKSKSAPAPMQPAEDPSAGLPPGHPPIARNGRLDQANPSPGGGQLEGKVLEVLDVSSYTYLRLATTTEGELWAAIPKTEVKVGESVSLTGATHMDGFESPTLKRRFDRIVFADLAR